MLLFKRYPLTEVSLMLNVFVLRISWEVYHWIWRQNRLKKYNEKKRGGQCPSLWVMAAKLKSLPNMSLKKKSDYFFISAWLNRKVSYGISKIFQIQSDLVRGRFSNLVALTESVGIRIVDYCCLTNHIPKVRILATCKMALMDVATVDRLLGCNTDTDYRKHR